MKWKLCLCVVTGQLVSWLQCHQAHQMSSLSARYLTDQFDHSVTGAVSLCLSDNYKVCRVCLLCSMPRHCISSDANAIVSCLPIAMQQILINYHQLSVSSFTVFHQRWKSGLLDLAAKSSKHITLTNKHVRHDKCLLHHRKQWTWLWRVRQKGQVHCIWDV